MQLMAAIFGLIKFNIQKPATFTFEQGWIHVKPSQGNPGQHQLTNVDGLT